MRSNTAYTAISNQDMLTATLGGLTERYDLGNKTIGEVVGGAVGAVGFAGSVACARQRRGGGAELVSLCERESASGP